MTEQVKQLSPRRTRQLERMQKLRAAAPKGIRVVPRDDEMRRLLKHPKVGAFRNEGSMEWPDDRFTKRRLADGSVKRAETAEKQEGAKPKPPPHHHRSDSNSAA